MSIAYLVLLGGCGGPEAGPEEQVRQWLSAGQQAVETKERGDLLDLISPSYADSRGFDRDDIGDRLRVYFLRQQSIKLLTSIEEIRLYGDSAAEVDLTVGCQTEVEPGVTAEVEATVDPFAHHGKTTR